MERLQEIGQTAVAITDHGNMYAGVSIYKLCKDAGIKYIHGIEFYICDNAKERDNSSRYYHLLALCKNEQGRQNLNKLVSISNLPENFYYKPRIDFEILKEYKDGLIICSACMAGEISKFLMKGDYGEAKRRALLYKAEFKEDYFLEIQAHRDEEQIALNQQIVALASECDIPIVVTTDAHYVKEDDRPYQNIYAFSGKYKEDGEGYIDCFVQSEDEVRQRLSYLDKKIVDDAIRNTDLIAENCNVELPLSAPIMPEITTPPEFDINESWLRAVCEQGCRDKLGFDINTLEDVTTPRFTMEEKESYKARYEYEFDSLRRMGFIDYILLVYSYSNVGKRRGKGRGSGGGSIINYFSNITDIDPIEHDLFFERFVDVSALDALEKGEITAKELKIPDIDLDFSGRDCEKVLLWLKEKYGNDCVASIGRFGSNYTKGTIRDIGKVMGFDLATTDMIAKAFGETQIEDIDRLVEVGEKIPESLQAAYEYTIKYPKLFEYVRKLSGLPKSFGLHPCGKVISTNYLDYYLPSCYDANGVRFLQGDMHDVEDVGLVKVDILGLRTLDHEYDALELSGESEEFINAKQEYNDDKVWEIFRKGDTTGIFQFSSQGMRNTLKKMEASSIDELSIANALFRPGAMAHIDEYCDRKKGLEEVTYYHPDLEPILKNTYGIIVFQEQLIQIARLAKMRNPDILRKMVGKKSASLIPIVKPELHDGLVARGWTEEQFNELWDVILASCSYMFNKSHSSAYAILAYMTAKEKAYYPAEFFAGLLSSYIGESGFVKDHSEEIFEDIAKHRIQYEALSFRNDHRRCSVKDGKIVYAIPLIKGMNESTADILYKNKDFTGDYFCDLLMDLYDDGLRSATLTTLISLGFFSEFGNSVKLKRILSVMDFFEWGTKLQMRKTSVNKYPDLESLVKKYSTDINDKGKIITMYRQIDINKIVHEFEDGLRAVEIDDVGLKIQVVEQRELMGLAPFPSGREEDRSLLFVTDVKPLCTKATGRQFGYSVYTTSFGSGIRTRFTVKGEAYRNFSTNPIQPNDIIRCLGYEPEKGFFNLKSWKQIYN